MSASEIRVRFAPSPTGYLHVGGLRTALFNYLFAKAHRGTFILRIEDTDRERLVAGATENLIESLQKVGIHFDEGPGTKSDCAPYVQSERLNLYKNYAAQLLAENKAYRCFCTQTELENMRNEQLKKKMQTRYTGKCRRLSPAEAEQKVSEGVPHTLRMKINYSDLEINFDDVVRGPISIKSSQLDDQVIMKSDGYPTYHLANVVDDHHMRISHVIRGEEWLPSTPKHVILYRLLGWDVPTFVHLPLLLNPDRSKLSKRQGDVATEDFLQNGYLPETLINFIALLGWNSGDEQELYTMDELIAGFSLEKVGKSGAVFDIQKLQWMNRQYINQLDDAALVQRSEPFLRKEYAALSDDQKLESIALARNGLITLKDINQKLDFLYNDAVRISDPALLEVIREESAQRVFQAFTEEARRTLEWSEAAFSDIMKRIQKKTGIKGKHLWIPMRIALSLEEHGPELPRLIVFFGREKCLQRLQNVLNP